jgi:hypothetical protein
MIFKSTYPSLDSTIKIVLQGAKSKEKKDNTRFLFGLYEQ